MQKPLVYLAGGIAGLKGVAAIDWRVDCRLELAEREIESLDPMRAKQCLRHKEKISTDFHDYENEGTFFTSQAIMTRDFNDVKRCDALLVNLIGLTKPSLGTIMELAWAYAMQKPAVVAIECRGNPHDNHPMIAAAMPFRVESLEDAVHAVAVILNR